MTNNLEAAKQLLGDTDWKTLNILGVLWNITKGLRRLNTTFGGFGLFSLSTKQLICQVNMLLQHYHVSTNLGKKLDASLCYLQLQLGTPHNSFTLDYKRWSHLAPLLWVMMLWRSLHHFNIHLHMSFPTLPSPREHQVIMEIFLAKDLSPTTTSSLSRCSGFLEAIFLLDFTTADRRYLEQFVFKPEKITSRSKYTFPREKPSRKDWNLWFDFWHSFTTTGGKLNAPLGKWVKPTHRIWRWHYREQEDDLQRIKDGKTCHYKPTSFSHWTRSMSKYQLV
jgi:hypothetical protein